MTAYLIVRAEVSEPDRAGFDRWYETEHLPQARAAFEALSAFRGWSDVTPGIHLAFYEFPDTARAHAVLASAGMKAMVAEFDRHWGARVPRTREVVEITQRV